MTMVTAADVVVRRSGRVLLDGLTLDVASGEVVGVVGPNGAGKSTLLRVLAGDIIPDEGSASIGGCDVGATSVLQLSHLRSFMGPQSSSDVVFRVEDVVAMGRHRERGPDVADIVADAMNRLDVAHLADRMVRTLSSGEQQRVNLARAIAQQAPVILLDEPTSALDIGHQELVMSVLRRLASEGVAVIAVLHDLNLAAAHAGRVLLLAEGKAVALGTPREVFTAARLTNAYAEPMEVIDHPFRDCPLVLTIGSR